LLYAFFVKGYDYIIRKASGAGLLNRYLIKLEKLENIRKQKIKNRLNI
jgi:hypothetical protein